MTFDSAIFLFCFFPVSYIIYRLIPGKRGRNAVLLISGVVFYAFGQLSGLAVLALSAGISYLAGILIISGKKPRLVMISAVAIDVAVLFSFKYLSFALQSLGLELNAAAWWTSLAVPLGISFFTFKSISYVVDVYRKPEEGTTSFFDLLLYLSFFPQITAGPITRFGQFSAQIESRSATTEKTAAGIRRMILGLAKKLLIAGTVAGLVDSVYAQEAANLDFRLCWLAAIGYTIQIYFDFSGYSDMAIGLGQVFGFDTPENFRSPYISDSITEFWRRWHISLSSWFKDYVYIPLGGNRKGRARTGLNKLIVFVLCGLWHGANWTFVLWGAEHGVLAALEAAGIINTKRMGKTAFGRVINHVYALLAVCLGFVIFRADSVSQGFVMISGMFTGFNITPASTLALQTGFTAAVAAAMGAGVLLSTGLGADLDKRLTADGNGTSAIASVISVGLLILCMLAMASGSFAPFIYSRF